MKFLVATMATAVAALAAPTLAHAATLVPDPDLACYPEDFVVDLPGAGFTPNAQVDFSRDGTPLSVTPPIVADAAGQVSATLTLPGIASGQRTLNYLATDTANPANTAALGLLVTAVDVSLKPERGKPQRLLRIKARGFFNGGKTLWAHIRRKGRRASRNVRIGRIKGPCKKVRAKRRLFAADAAYGRYRIQFDAFRRFRKKREYKTVFGVTIYPRVEPGTASVTVARR